MQLYWKWIMDTAQRDAALYPDANVILAENKEMTLSEETDYDFLQPQLQELEPKQRRLFTTFFVVSLQSRSVNGAHRCRSAT